MRILLSNDDGFDSPGILGLKETLDKLGHEVWLAAPSRERSTAGHSLTLHKPLRIQEVRERVFSISGSPADCVYLARKFVLKAPADLIISGVNYGANLGNDIFYSGTVAAAREGCLYGQKAIAISLCKGFPHRSAQNAAKKTDSESHSQIHWQSAFQCVEKILAWDFIRETNDPEHHYPWIMNVNVPNLSLAEIKGIKLTRQGRRLYSEDVTRNLDPRGRPYYWIGGGPTGYGPEEGTDCVAVAQGWISVTPLKIDTTDDQALAKMRECPPSW